MTSVQLPLSIPFKKKKHFSHLAGSAVFVAIGAWMISQGDPRGLLVLIFFGFCFVVFLSSLIRGKRNATALIIGEKQFQYISQAVPDILWGNIRSSRLIVLPQYSYLAIEVFAPRPSIIERILFQITQQSPDFSKRPPEEWEIMILADSIEFNIHSLKGIIDEQIALHRSGHISGVGNSTQVRLDRADESRAEIEDPHSQECIQTASIFRVGVLYGLGLVLVYCWQTWRTYTAEGTFLPSSASLVRDGGNIYTQTILESEWFRFLTATFLHLSPFHLFLNLIAAYLACVCLERVLNTWLFLLLVVLGGIVGSICSVFVHAPNVVSVGASGAILAVLAGGFVFLSRETDRQEKEVSRYSLLTVLIPSLLPVSRHVQAVDFAAHAGGALSGLFIAQYLLRALPKNISPKTHRKITHRAQTLLALSLITLLANYLLLP